LECHEPLAQRIRAGAGYHATVTSACADCHKEHLGRDFDLLRLDEASFRHADAGYDLRASHARIECRACHEGEHVSDPEVRVLKARRGALYRTYLGLSTECVTCHRAEDPHDGQFSGRSCATCHDEGTWTSAPLFDHGAAKFALLGAHDAVGCVECHTPSAGGATLYRPVAHESCATCHEDPHAGAMGGTCETCHAPSAWQALRNTDLTGIFDHGRTAFALRGAHGRAECVTCHRAGSPPSTELLRMTYVPGTTEHAYPRPRAESCASCHVDRHAFPAATGRWAACETCHTEEAWSPTDFGLARHDGEASFPLDGAHAVVPCVLCHLDPEAGHARFTLAVSANDCRSCHEHDNPHDASYDAFACERCHVVEAFSVVAFDHDLASATEPSCAGCHAVDDPHAGQFSGRDCAGCHGTESFVIDSFDHGATRFPLDGAHARTACAGCHVTESGPQGAFVRYVPLPAECADCHGGPR
jgi:hypothetical protein